LFQYENLQLDKDERASSTSSCELLEPCNSDYSFYVIDPDNLECSIVSQLTESSARHLRNYAVLITKMFIIINLCLTIWQNDVFWGLKYRMDTCGWSKSYAWRAEGPPVPDMTMGRPSDTTRNPCLAITERQVVEQTRDSIAAKIYKQVGDDKQAMKMSQAYIDDEPSKPEIMGVALAHYEACEDVQTQLRCLAKRRFCGRLSPATVGRELGVVP
jgi:hypothetical protein